MLGDEFDDELRARLANALRQLEAIPLNPADKFLAGSQELEALDLSVKGCLVHVEAETYVGLSITGSPSIIENIQQLITYKSEN